MVALLLFGEVRNPEVPILSEAEIDLGTLSEPGHLPSQFVVMPDVVRIEEGDVRAVGRANPRVFGSRCAPTRLEQAGHFLSLIHI